MNRIVGAVKARKGMIVKGLIAFGVIATAAVVAGAMKKDEPIDMQFGFEPQEDEVPLDIQPEVQE